MIKLENIAVEELTNGLSYPGIPEFVRDNKIKTLADFFRELHQLPNVNWCEIDSRMSWLFRNMETYNKRGKEPVIFSVKGYTDSSLESMDYKNTGGILLLESPTVKKGNTYSAVKKMSVEEIKRYISLVRSNGDNALMSFANKIGLHSLSIILNALNMYTDQIERQAKLTDRRDINLFEFELDERKRIIEKRIVDIIAYLIHNAKELTWDELTEYKYALYELATVKNCAQDVMIKNRMTDMIAGYTTMEEAEEVQDGDFQVLKRFIVK